MSNLSTYIGNISSLSSGLSSLSSTVGTPTAAATANTLAKRDANKCASFGTATASDHAVVKAQLDSTNSTLSALGITVGTPTAAATASQLALRDGSGNCSFAAATASGHAVIKSQLDTTNTNVSSLSTTVSTMSTTLSTLSSTVSALAANVQLANGGTKSANFTIAASTFYALDLGAAAGDFTGTLPNATTCDGQVIELYIITTGHNFSFVLFGSQTLLNSANSFTLQGLVRIRAFSGNWLVG